MALPKPILSGDDIAMARHDAPSLILNTWNEDPTKMAVLRAILSCYVMLRARGDFCWNIGDALAQRYVCFYLFIFIGRGSH